jgi:uncharacterized membrane protein YecN with MAPEG domain
MRKSTLVELPCLISITPIYSAILGLRFIVCTMRAGLYRVKTKVLIGTGDDLEIVRRVHGQANFIETAPIAHFLLIVMEVLGASGIWLNALGLALVLGLIAHYQGLTELGPLAFRSIGMAATLAGVQRNQVYWEGSESKISVALFCQEYWLNAFCLARSPISLESESIAMRSFSASSSSMSGLER